VLLRSLGDWWGDASATQSEAASSAIVETSLAAPGARRSAANPRILEGHLRDALVVSDRRTRVFVGEESSGGARRLASIGAADAESRCVTSDERETAVVVVPARRGRVLPDHRLREPNPCQARRSRRYSAEMELALTQAGLARELSGTAVPRW